MTFLIIMLLLILVAIYAVFFLLFKVVWMILKKNTNKWPLILAGLSTVLFLVVFGGAAAWGAYKVVSPFRGIISRISEDKAPEYGERVYTDPVYRFEVDVYDGMDFSEWMHFDDVDVKLGIDTNAFKKDNAGKSYEGPITFAGLIRQTDVDDGHPLEDLRGALAAGLQRRQLDITDEQELTIDGRPALYVAGTAYSNRGESAPFWLTAAYDNYGQVFYVITFTVGEGADGNAEKTARSLRFVSGPALTQAAPADTSR